MARASSRRANTGSASIPIALRGSISMARLKDTYKNTVAPNLQKQFEYSNVMQIPKVDKIVVNMGVGRAGQTGGAAKLLDNAMRDMGIVTGQKPAVTRCKKSISN